MAGEVDNPQRNFLRGFIWAVIFTCLAYLVPLIAVTGVVSVDQSKWETGFHAEAAKIIAGDWLRICGAVISAISLFEAQLSSCAYQILGMADHGILPQCFAVRSKMFGTPWVGILVSTVIVLALSYMSFTVIISSANFLYSLGMLLEFASFIRIRWKMPRLKRLYRVPMGMTGLVLMCLAPSAFLVFVMVIAKKTVLLVSAIMTVAGGGWFFLMRLCKSKNLLQFSVPAEE